MKDIFVGRQPILGKDLKLNGYELLFRSDNKNYADFKDDNQATSEVILNAFMEIGLEKIVGKHRAYINLPQDFLINNTTFNMPCNKVVFEILEHIPATEDVIEAIKKLSNHGFTIALDDFIYHKSLQPLVDYANIIKLDIQVHSREDLESLVKQLGKPDVRLLAEKVETQEEYEFCKSLEFDLYQGYFFAKPNIIKGSRIPANRLNLMRLLSILQNPNVEIKELVDMVTQDVTLSYRVLRYINSAYFGLRNKVESIHRALSLMGFKHVKQLIGLLTLSKIDDKPEELFVTAMIRAKMCELYSEELRYKDSDKYFTVGLFSTLDALFDKPMEEILEELPLTSELSDALSNYSGSLGEILKYTLAYEQGNWDLVKSSTLETDNIRQLYLESIAWADNINNSIT